MELNQVLAKLALPILLDLVEIVALNPACAMLTPMEKQPHQTLLAASPPGRQVHAHHAKMAYLLLKQLLVQQPPRVQTARVKPATTLMEYLANAHNAILVIRQLVERKLQKHQRK